MKLLGNIDDLRALDAAVDGQLYRKLGVCMEAKYTPHLRAVSVQDELEDELYELYLFFEGRSDDEDASLSDMWTLRADTHPEAFQVALRMLLEETKKEVDRSLALMRAAVATLDKLVKGNEGGRP